MATQDSAAPACPLLELSDDALGMIGHEMSDALRPSVACALAASCAHLWRVLRAPLAALQPRHAAARALAAKVGSSCAELREAVELLWGHKGLDAAAMGTLALLLSTGSLPRVKRIYANGAAVMPALCGLRCGAAPRLTVLSVASTGLGLEGASTLAAALARGALPNLEELRVGLNEMGDAGLAALAAPLRRRPGLKKLDLGLNGIGDSVATLVDNLGAKELKNLEALYLIGNAIGDAGCAALVAALDGATLPALRLRAGQVSLVFGNSAASAAAKRAVDDALRANEARHRHAHAVS